MSWLAAPQNSGANFLCDKLNPLDVYAASEALDPNVRNRYFINRRHTSSRIKRPLGRWLLNDLRSLPTVASVLHQLI